MLKPLSRPPIDEEEMVRLCTPLLSERDQDIFATTGGADFAYTMQVEDTDWRFRINIFRQMGHIGLVARRVNSWIPNFEQLHLPKTLDKLCHYHQGLIVLSGITGSGKSTTIASMLDYINHKYRKHIITLEDPIEFVFREDKCLISQRDVGLDVLDFETAMKHAVREDPDVILVGEMRDRDTFMAAMQAAETGHLVFATIHASSAATTVARVLDFFPASMHGSIRGTLAANLLGIVSQKLLPSIHENINRVPTVEIMLCTPTVKKLILTKEDEKLSDAIRIGEADGMQDFTLSLKNLVENDLIDRQVAFENAPSPDVLKMALKGIDISQRGIL